MTGYISEKAVLRRVRVLYLINYAGKAGMEKYVENLVRLLPQYGLEPFFAYNLPGELSEKMARAGVPSLQVTMEWRCARRAARTLADYCRANGIEVIHAQCSRENIMALLAKKFEPRLRVVFTSHFTEKCGGAWRMLYRRFTPRDHCVIAVCPECRDTLIANGCAPEKIKVIYNGIEPKPLPARSDALRHELGLGEDTFLMSIFARFEPEKGLDMLIKALARLKKMTDKPFCCAVAGDGSLFEEIRAQAAAAGLERELRLLGYRQDTEAILTASDMYVCSSLCNEALSFAILEAMNAGLPLVVTAVGGNRDLAEAGGVCGLVTPPDDDEAFADALARMMADSGLRAKCAETAKAKISERFDLAKLAKDVYDTYF
ncbi:MAG: glycosyltransferase family 4 protein [Oscillospiraceae bacterium]|nr:glycosyltransferase family 4 protein [Oscillospiraceae bacterium]